MFLAALLPQTAEAAPVWVSGAETGVVDGAGGGIFDNVNGPTAIAAVDDVTRNGEFALRVAPTGVASTYASVALANPTVVVSRFAVRFDGPPPSGTRQIFSVRANTGNSLALYYDGAAQTFKVGYGTNFASGTTPVAARHWYVIEMRMSLAGPPRTIEWRISGVAQPTYSNSDSNNGAGFATGAQFGTDSNTDAYTAWYDDMMLSTTSADYGLYTDGRVLALEPDAESAHVTPASFVNNDGSAIGASTPGRLDDRPMTSTADYVRQGTVGGSAYVGLGLRNTQSTLTARAVRGVVAYNSSAGGSNNGQTRFRSGTAETTIQNGDMAGTALKRRGGMITAPLGGWTPTNVDALEARVGYSTANASGGSLPQWQSVVAEVEYAPAPQAEFVGMIGSSTAASAGTTLSVPLQRGLPQGTQLVVIVAADVSLGSSPPAIADSAGTRYQDLQRGASNGLGYAIAKGVTTRTMQAGSLVTLQLPASGTARAAAVYAFDGMTLNGSADGSPGAAMGTSTTPSQSITTAVTRQLLLATFHTDGPSSDSTTTPTSWISSGLAGTSAALNRTVFGFHRIVTTTGTYTANPTLGNSRSWVATIQTFPMSDGTGRSVLHIGPVPSSGAGVWEEGALLTSTGGSWRADGLGTAISRYWERCDATGATCRAITGSGTSYTATSADVGSTLRHVVIRATAGGNAIAYSESTPVIQTMSAPVNVGVPTISGSAVSGQTLTTTNGTWNGAGITYAVRWQRCDSSGAACADVTGEDQATYWLAKADVGATLRSVVTATNSAGSAEAFSAVTAVVADGKPDLEWFTGFETGGTGGLFTGGNGTPVADTTTVRTGNYAMHCLASSAKCSGSRPLTSSATGVAVRLAVFLPANPSGDDIVVAETDNDDGHFARVGVTTTGQTFADFRDSVGTSLGRQTGPALSLGVWHLVEFRPDYRRAEWRLDWRIDGAAQTQATHTYTSPSFTSGIRVGSFRYPAAATPTVIVDDVAVSTSGAGYPLGDGGAIALRPDTLGTSSAGVAAHFTNDDTSAVDATTPGRLDERFGTGTDYLLQTTTSTGEFVELNMQDTPRTSIANGVHALLQYRSASTTTNRGETRILDNAGGETGVGHVVGTGLDMSFSAAAYASNRVTQPAAGWTPAEVNALRGRLGFSADADPIPYWEALALEVDYPFGPEISTITPNTQAQGRTGAAVRIIGSGFMAGATVTFTGSGVTVSGSPVVTSSTQIDLVVDVASAATLGARDVTMTNSDGSVASLVGGFTVVAPAITVSATSLGHKQALPRTSCAISCTLSFGAGVLPGDSREVGTVGSGQTAPGEPAVELGVASNVPWYMTTQASDFTGPSPMSAGQLAWSRHGSGPSWTGFTTTAADLEGSSASPNAPTAGQPYEYDLRMSVPALQQAGNYSTTVTFTVTAAP